VLTLCAGVSCGQVADVKTKLEQMDANMEASRQRLIFKGKVLKDDVTVESTGVTENDFFVCMINKVGACHSLSVISVDSV
jgi:hypothetical protein